MRAIRFHQTGGPDVMRLETVDLPPPRPGEVRVRHAHIGVNFIDTYHRSGLYQMRLPSGLGVEAAGRVEALGEGVISVAVDDRVAYCGGAPGAYSEAANVPANRLVKLPDGVGTDAAAAVMLKGLTVQYLFRQTYKLARGETIVFHAAAGGTGLIACQWARHLGVNMIATVGSAEKSKLALAHGASTVINYREEDVAKRVKELTQGRGVPVVYDGVGKDTFVASLDCLEPRGLLVSFGNASGPVTGVDLGILAAKGSLYITRPTLATYTARQEDLAAAAAELLGLLRSGAIKPDITQVFRLEDAEKAHRALEGRATTGSLLLAP